MLYGFGGFSPFGGGHFTQFGAAGALGARAFGGGSPWSRYSSPRFPWGSTNVRQFGTPGSPFAQLLLPRRQVGFGNTGLAPLGGIGAESPWLGSRLQGWQGRDFSPERRQAWVEARSPRWVNARLRGGFGTGLLSGDGRWRSGREGAAPVTRWREPSRHTAPRETPETPETPERRGAREASEADLRRLLHWGGPSDGVGGLGPSRWAGPWGRRI